MGHQLHLTSHHLLFSLLSPPGSWNPFIAGTSRQSPHLVGLTDSGAQARLHLQSLSRWSHCLISSHSPYCAGNFSSDDWVAFMLNIKWTKEGQSWCCTYVMFCQIVEVGVEGPEWLTKMIVITSSISHSTPRHSHRAIHISYLHNQHQPANLSPCK